jgi:hypothetical protein
VRGGLSVWQVCSRPLSNTLDGVLQRVWRLFVVPTGESRRRPAPPE